MATKQDFTNEAAFFSGNDVLFDFQASDEVTGDPMNIGGLLQLTCALARSARAQPIIEKTLADGVVMVDPSIGKATVVISSLETEPLAGKYYYEIRLVNSQGKKLTLTYGDIEFKVNLVQD